MESIYKKKDTVFKGLLFFFLLNSSLGISAKESDTKLLENLDNHAIGLFENLKQHLIEETDPILMVWNTQFSLYHKGTVRDFPVDNTSFNELKTVAHLCVLGLFGLLQQPIQNHDDLRKVIDYKKLVVQARKQCIFAQLTSKQKKRQDKILQSAEGFLDQVIKAKHGSPEKLRQFFLSIRELAIQNIQDGGKIMIQLANEQMVLIRSLLSSEEYSRLFILIPTTKMTEKNNGFGLFFAKFTGEAMDSDKLIFAQGATNLKEALSVLGDWKVQRAIGSAFFNSPKKMESELLGDYSKEYIDHCHFALEGISCPHKP